MLFIRFVHQCLLKADGWYSPVTKGMMLAKASQIRKGVTDSFRSKEQRKELISQICVDKGDFFETTKDQYFESPSGAACFVLGRSANGKKEFVDAKGK